MASFGRYDYRDHARRGRGGGGTSAVLSVNGKTGSVVLTANDVGAASAASLNAVSIQATNAETKANSAEATANSAYQKASDAETAAAGISAVSAQVTANTADISALSANVSGLAPKVSQNEADISSIKTDLAALSANVSAIDGAIAIQNDDNPGSADAANLARIIRYTGNTTADFVQNEFYQCVFNGSGYVWEKFSFGGGGGTAIGYSVLGTYNASSNTPDLVSSHPENESIYIVEDSASVQLYGMTAPVSLTAGSVIIYDNDAFRVILASSGGGGGGGAVSSVNGKTGAVVLSKSDLGLANADNTADIDKPVSTAQKNYVDTSVSDLNTALSSEISDAKDDVSALETRVENNEAEIESLKSFRLSSMPLASTLPDKIVQFVGATGGDYVKGYFYRSTPEIVSGELTYAWKQINVQPSENDYENLDNKPQINGIELSGDKSGVQLNLQSTLQYSVLPEANASNLGKIYQYAGGDVSGYKNGYFYQCQFNASDSTYAWKQVDVSSNSALDSRISQVESDIGDMSLLEVSAVSDLVSALNKINAKAGIEKAEYSEPNLVIYYNDGTTFQVSIGDILNETQIGELQNVIDDTIEDGDVLQYDAALKRYKPYAILTALQILLSDSKDYTDKKVADAIVAGAYVCDEKPDYDADNDIVVYKQGGTTKTTTQTDARFYYYDNDGNPMCSSWIDDVEFTFSVSDVDFSDYVSKSSDVVSVYTGEELDTSKIPDLAALNDLKAIIVEALAEKVNVSDVKDALTSQDTEAPLSANQGYVLKNLVDAKQDVLQYPVMPQADTALLGKIVQYTGGTSPAYTRGYFYQCTVDEDGNYSWSAIKYAASVDSELDEDSDNAVKNKAITAGINAKQDILQYSVLPAASASNLGKIFQYTGASGSDYKKGYFYVSSYDSEHDNYFWKEIRLAAEVSFTELVADSGEYEVSFA